MSTTIVTIIVALIGSGVFNTLLTCYLNNKSKRKEELDLVMKAQRLLMKKELRSLCSHCNSQGWIYEDELEDLMAMHTCYHNDLKGNGFLDSEMARVQQLEIRRDGGVL